MSVVYKTPRLMMHVKTRAALDERLRREPGVPVHVAEDPLICVAIGSGRCLEEIEYYRTVLSSA